MKLFLDSYASHLSIEALDLAKYNGITMITFLPTADTNRSLWAVLFLAHSTHTSIILPPIGWGSFWLKTNHKYFSYCWSYLSTGYDSIIILYGLRVSEISPSNKHILDDDIDFAPAFVTDRSPTYAVSQPFVDSTAVSNNAGDVIYLNVDDGQLII